MRHPLPRTRWSAVLRAAGAAALLGLLLAGCNGDSDEETGPTLSEQALPDFALEDVNAASPTGGTSVSVRSYLGEVSAWYFAHAT